MLSISTQLKMLVSPDIYSGDNQCIHASSFRSYLKKKKITGLRQRGETKQGRRVEESIRADKQSTTRRAEAKDETTRYKGIRKARTLVFLAIEKGEL